MAYKFEVRYPRGVVTRSASTEEAALSYLEELEGQGARFSIVDEAGDAVDRVDLEDRIDSKGQPSD